MVLIREVVFEQPQEEAPPGAVREESRHVTVAIDLRDRAETEDRRPNLFLESLPMGEQVLDLGHRPGVLRVCRSDFCERVLRRDVAIYEIEVAGLELDDAFAPDGEMLYGVGIVLPVVLPVVETCADHLFGRLTVVDREAEDVGGNEDEIELECDANSSAIREAGIFVDYIREDTALKHLSEAVGRHTLVLEKFQEFYQLL